MAHAKLHIICGNCGSNDDFTYSIDTEINDDNGQKFQTVYISCKNCNTLHHLDSNATKKDK